MLGAEPQKKGQTKDLFGARKKTEPRANETKAQGEEQVKEGSQRTTEGVLKV